MQAVRHLLAQRRLAVLICAAALLLKLLVPAGYMIGSDHGHPVITPCSGVVSRGVTMAMPDMHGGMADHGKTKDHGKAEMPCAFAGLSAATLGAIDPVQLAALIAFILIVGRAGTVRRAPRRPANLRPPLRGPPIRL